MEIMGQCDPAFRFVREEFARNFAERGEVGASVCVLVAGKPVVDLWGGAADRFTARPWQRDTLGVVWSCTKGAVALCAHLLAHEGKLDLDASVSRYWPEFAAAGKADIPVRWLLTHQSGVAAIRAPLPPGSAYDWDFVVGKLAAEEPFWEPGTRQGYHAATFGHLVGELVRRVSGQSLSDFFREKIALPYGLDFHLGLPEVDEPRVAPTIRPDPLPSGAKPWRFLTRIGTEGSIQTLTVRNRGRAPGDTDSRQAHAACLPSEGGITNARGLAGLYAAIPELLPASIVEEIGDTHSASAVDATLLLGMRFGLGFMKSSDNRRGPEGARDSLLLGRRALGHAGMGGSLGFLDPQREMAFGYAMSKQGHGVLLNERGQALADAAYAALG
ncbi:MAG: beta-lactamase family protein [Gemmataceae bacterium]|nr:beta-lactamase family protein [Gemmataceae bacterium]